MSCLRKMGRVQTTGLRDQQRLCERACARRRSATKEPTHHNTHRTLLCRSCLLQSCLCCNWKSNSGFDFLRRSTPSGGVASFFFLGKADAGHARHPHRMRHHERHANATATPLHLRLSFVVLSSVVHFNTEGGPHRAYSRRITQQRNLGWVDAG